ncbi:3-oxoacyl-[acyl-carrier-protein] synthase III C-terminal domain-containing protein [Glycomyces xiaoerkulensis]|uniref:3-oxoacyl-[acyl-carrier-protein] synthase III C-terminal domain-containing protein n=1 Tax=Glycomyces xiaoerkulensis TaxID=2038139 RepID=UPI000C256810|nr:3-oxoacyl-[acyl-carrier-protein] synthase III C-terminal domain-containing protein [Glycomyces xiaoerkulensis]
MTAIAEVASHIPSKSETIEQVGEQLDIDKRHIELFTRFFGLREVRVAPERSYTDRLVDAAGNLGQLQGNESRVRYVLIARTARDLSTTTEDPVHEVVERLGLDNAIGFAVTEHACASALYAIWMGGWLLRDEDPDSLALVLMGEVPEMEGFYLPGTAVMGDSTAACLVSASGERDRLCSYAFKLNPSCEQALAEAVAGYKSTEEAFSQHMGHATEELGKIYIEELSEVLQEAAERSGLALEDMKLILPHNVNRISWRRVCKRIGFPMDKVMTDLIPITGHCYTADSFLNYVEALRQDYLEPGDHYMVVGVGTHGSFASMVFQR